jgi:peptidoglycan DL-endopeptidase LytE
MPIRLRRPASPLAALATAAGLLLSPFGPQAHADQSSHVVQPGETLRDIAGAAGVDADDLARLNRLEDSDVILVGQALALPASAGGAGAAPSAAATPTAAVAAPSRNGSSPNSYTVAAGDTLWSIAQRLGSTTDAVVRANGLADPNQVHVGDQLVVPGGASLGNAASAAAAPAPTAGPAAPAAKPSPKTTSADASGAAGQTAASTGPNRAPAQAAPPGSVASGTFGSTSVASSAGAPAGTPKPAATPSPTTTPKPTADHPPSGGVTPPKPQAPSVPADGLAALAAKFLGTPYVWGGSAPSGFDCSGFVWYVAQQSGRSIPRTLAGEYASGSHPSRAELKPGDLVFFQNTYGPGLTHSGIYLGNGKFISAADEAAGVTVSDLDSSYWSAHWYGASRLQ